MQSLTIPDVADTLKALLEPLDMPQRVGVALLLSKRLLRDLPQRLQQDTADEFATEVRRLHSTLGPHDPEDLTGSATNNMRDI